MVGNGFQDIHIKLSNLPSGRTVSTILALGDGGGGWVDNIGNYYPTSSGALIEPSGGATADFYVEPFAMPVGKRFDLLVTFDDKSTASCSVFAGVVNPNLPMPSALVAGRWVGQDGLDLTGPTPGVGPDGIQDAHVAVSNLFAASAVAGVSVTNSLGQGWASGTNAGLLNNAEFRRNSTDPTRGDLYFSPDHDVNGQTFTVTVMYADGKTNHSNFLAGSFNPNLALPAPPPTTVNWSALQARWIGQDGLNLIGAGDVHVTLVGIIAGRSVVRATLSDQVGLAWTYIKPGSGGSSPDPNARVLGFRAATDATKADLTFPPGRNESGATLTVSVVLDDGSVLAARLAGDVCDIGLRAPDVAPTFVLAHPGDDLNDLANHYGTVRLVAGTYPMSVPLVLNHAVTITGDPGSTLVFAQRAGDPTWTTAIKVRASHTTLNGFAVRFAGPIRWTDGISFGSAVIGSSDNFDPWNGDPLLDLAFTHLDLQSPPASSSWEETPRTFRLANAGSGTISDNLIKGGVTEVQGGPWTITGNTVVGTPVNTFSYGAFATHYSHDVTISANTVAPSGPQGKTWRFLVMTQSGLNDVVSGNTVIGVGPMDNDTVVNPNSSETILTEAYHIHYEGLTSSVSSDGLVVTIPMPQDVPARSGDVLAILTGSQAGQWRLIAQVLSPTTYVLDAPITPGKFAVSLATGFVNEMYLGNTVDARGSSTALDMVLAGNQFGVTVVGNHFIGGATAFKITACPSETPVNWGWTHAPLLGATINSNVVEDTYYGGNLDVEHGGSIKSDSGRVYFSGSFVDNTGIWSSAFLASRTAAGVTVPPALVTVGDANSGDPGDLILTSSGNVVTGPLAVVSNPTFMIAAATVNGVSQRNTGVVLPAAPTTTRPAAPMTVPSSPPAPVKTAPASPPAPTPPIKTPVPAPIVKIPGDRKVIPYVLPIAPTTPAAFWTRYVVVPAPTTTGYWSSGKAHPTRSVPPVRTRLPAVVARPFSWWPTRTLSGLFRPAEGHAAIWRRWRA